MGPILVTDQHLVTIIHPILRLTICHQCPTCPSSRFSMIPTKLSIRATQTTGQAHTPSADLPHAVLLFLPCMLSLYHHLPGIPLTTPSSFLLLRPLFRIITG